MTRIFMRPAVKAAMDDFRKRLPKLVRAAIKESLNPRPPTFTVRLLDKVGNCLLTDGRLTKRQLGQLKRAWPLYLAERGAPPEGSRLALVGDELQPIS